MERWWFEILMGHGRYLLPPLPITQGSGWGGVPVWTSIPGTQEEGLQLEGTGLARTSPQTLQLQLRGPWTLWGLK